MGVSTLWFNGQFWVLTLELIEGDKLHAAQRVLGTKPGDAELYQLMLRIGNDLIREALASPGVAITEAEAQKHVNPKRIARQARDDLKLPSTTAQRALQHARDEAISNQRAEHRKRTRHEKEMIRLKRRERAKERHRGH